MLVTVDVADSQDAARAVRELLEAGFEPGEVRVFAGLHPQADHVVPDWRKK